MQLFPNSLDTMILYCPSKVWFLMEKGGLYAMYNAIYTTVYVKQFFCAQYRLLKLCLSKESLYIPLL